MRTYSPKASDIKRDWFVIDAQGKTLGRVATEVARLLRGKHKPMFTPHMDTGDFVIIVNCAKVDVAAGRLDEKVYYRHSMYPGGLKSITLRDQLARHPERVLESAVKGMLPHNKLGRTMFKKMKVYPGDKHPHQAQQPKPWTI